MIFFNGKEFGVLRCQRAEFCGDICLTRGSEKAEGSRVGRGPKVSGLYVWPQEDTSDNHLKRSSVICWQEGRARSQGLEERGEGLKKPSQSGKSEVDRQGEGPKGLMLRVMINTPRLGNPEIRKKQNQRV